MCLKDRCRCGQPGQVTSKHSNRNSIIWICAFVLMAAVGADCARPTEQAADHNEVRQRRALQATAVAALGSMVKSAAANGTSNLALPPRSTLLDQRFAQQQGPNPYYDDGQSRFVDHDESEFDENVPVRVRRYAHDQVKDRLVKKLAEKLSLKPDEVAELSQEQMEDLENFEGQLARLFQIKMAAQQDDGSRSFQHQLEEKAGQMGTFASGMETQGSDSLKGMDQYEANVQNTEKKMMELNETLRQLEATRVKEFTIKENERMQGFDDPRIRPDEWGGYRKPAYRTVPVKIVGTIQEQEPAPVQQVPAQSVASQSVDAPPSVASQSVDLTAQETSGGTNALEDTEPERPKHNPANEVGTVAGTVDSEAQSKKPKPATNAEPETSPVDLDPDNDEEYLDDDVSIVKVTQPYKHPGSKS